MVRRGYETRMRTASFTSSRRAFVSGSLAAATLAALDDAQQAAVVEVVRRELLTPFGLLPLALVGRTAGEVDQQRTPQHQRPAGLVPRLRLHQHAADIGVDDDRVGARIGLALILAGALVSKGTIRTALSFAPLQVVGMMCFSIYIWHLPILGFFVPVWGRGIWSLQELVVRFCAFIATTGIISIWSYRFVEFRSTDNWRSLFLIRERSRIVEISN